MATTGPGALEGVRGLPGSPRGDARRGPTVFGFLLAMVLLPIGAALTPFGIGIPIFAIGLAGQLRD
jgi:hypothetical protein